MFDALVRYLKSYAMFGINNIVRNLFLFFILRLCGVSGGVGRVGECCRSCGFVSIGYKRCFRCWPLRLYFFRDRGSRGKNRAR